MAVSDDQKTEALREWNRLARENTENDIVSSLFEAISNTSAPVEKFSTWLLVGTVATGAFLITNSDQLLDLTNKNGFIWIAAFICLSCTFGLVSRIFALICSIQIDVSKNARRVFFAHLEKHEADEEQIQKSSDFWGITLETGIRTERVLAEYMKPMPKLIIWYVNWKSNRTPKDLHADQHLFVKSLNKQSLFAFLQSLMFLGFLISGFVSMII